MGYPVNGLGSGLCRKVDGCTKLETTLFGVMRCFLDIAGSKASQGLVSDESGGGEVLFQDAGCLMFLWRAANVKREDQPKKSSLDLCSPWSIRAAAAATASGCEDSVYC